MIENRVGGLLVLEQLRKDCQDLLILASEA